MAKRGADRLAAIRAGAGHGQDTDKSKPPKTKAEPAPSADIAPAKPAESTPELPPAATSAKPAKAKTRTKPEPAKARTRTGQVPAKARTEVAGMTIRVRTVSPGVRVNVDVLSDPAAHWAAVAATEGLTRGELVMALIDQHGSELAKSTNLRKLAMGTSRDRWPLTLTPDEADDLAEFSASIAAALGRRSTSAAVTALLVTAMK